MLQCALVAAGTAGGRQSLHQGEVSSQWMGVSDRPGLTADPAVFLGVAAPTSVNMGGTGFAFQTPGASFPAMDWEDPEVL